MPSNLLEITADVAENVNVMEPFIRTALALAGEAGIDYVVLRNYEELPIRAGNDIDILVAPEQFNDFSTCLLAAASRTGWVEIRRTKRFSFGSYTFGHSKNGSSKLLRWDFLFPITWRGLEWVDCDTILASRIPYNGFFAPSPGAEAAVLCLKDVIQVGKIRSKYQKRIQTLFYQGPQEFRSVLLDYWGQETVDWLEECIRRKQWQDIERQIVQIHKNRLLRKLRTDFFKTGARFFKFLLGHMQDYLRADKRGHFLCLIGPDGSGKTTVAQTLLDELDRAFDGANYYHGHLGILPELKVFWTAFRRSLGRSQNTPRETSNPLAGSDTLPRWRALLYVSYYTLEYVLGHLIIYYRVRRGQLLVFDRYFYDYLIQDAFRRVPRWFLWLIHTLVPKPDLLIWLRNEPEVIHKRKQELTVEQLRRQLEACEHIMQLSLQGTVVWTNKTADAVVAEVSSHVLQNVAGKRAIRSKS